MQKESGFIALDSIIQTIVIPSSFSSRAVCPSGEGNPDIELRDHICCSYKSGQDHVKNSLHRMQMAYSNKVSTIIVICIKISGNIAYGYFL